MRLSDESLDFAYIVRRNVRHLKRDRAAVRPALAVGEFVRVNMVGGFARAETTAAAHTAGFAEFSRADSRDNNIGEPLRIPPAG